jgi:hypothetical protein
MRKLGSGKSKKKNTLKMKKRNLRQKQEPTDSQVPQKKSFIPIFQVFAFFFLSIVTHVGKISAL